MEIEFNLFTVAMLVSCLYAIAAFWDSYNNRKKWEAYYKCPFPDVKKPIGDIEEE